MRVISGRFGSRRIKTLKGDNTRPTSDKIRGAVFNSIGPYFDGGSFLDGFGGSGAIGIEAISRGFDSVTVIENNFNALKVIKKNVNDFKINDVCRIIKGDTLKIIGNMDETYDYIYLDPPYAYPHINELINIIGERKLVNHTLLVETANDTVLDESDYFELIKVLDYAATKIYIYQPK